jgi:hypothetical protein
VSDSIPWADPGGAGGADPFQAENAIFIEECNFQTKIFPRKGTRSLHKTTHFPQKKSCFFATRKDMESQMPGKCILALEFSNSETPSGAQSHPLHTAPIHSALHSWLLQ